MTLASLSTAADCTPAERSLSRLLRGTWCLAVAISFQALPAAAAPVGQTLPHQEECLDLTRMNAVSEAERAVLRIEWRAGLAREEEGRLLNEMFERIERLQHTARDVYHLIEVLPNAGSKPAPVSRVEPAAEQIAQQPAPPPVSSQASSQTSGPSASEQVSGALKMENAATRLAALIAAALLLFTIAVIVQRRREKSAFLVAPTTPAVALEPASPAPAKGMAAAKSKAKKRESLPPPILPAPLASPAPAAPAPAPVAAPSPAVASVANASAAKASTPVPSPATAAPAEPASSRPGYDQTLELAEIMLSMGLASGAAHALVEHIEANPRSALAHWLKLLEVYREDGHRADFERAAKELQKNFNIRADDWMRASNTQQPTLEKFDRIFKHVQEVWHQPTECIAYLTQLLEDNREGMRAGFPQPVVEEMLMLINIQHQLESGALEAGLPALETSH